MHKIKEKLSVNDNLSSENGQFIKRTEKKITIAKIALVGNPNCGKTTLFNHLTGSAQYVGNWPGVTVERKEGKLKNSNILAHIVDLPGIYSLSVYSPEEVITRNYIINEPPDLIINILDSTNMERSLYLTTQLMELECKMILALNMTDILKRRGKNIDYKLLEQKIGLPVIPISANKNSGVNELIEKAKKIIKEPVLAGYCPKIYSKDVENVLSFITSELKRNNHYSNLRFKSVKLLESDSLIISDVRLPKNSLDNILKASNSLNIGKNIDQEILIADQRYKYICKLCGECIKDTNKFKKIHSMSKKIDDFISSKFLAIPIFFLIMFFVFFVTFGPFGVFFKTQAEKFIELGIGNAMSALLESVNAPFIVRSLILDSLIKGVGSVISFLPQILILFAFLSLLEDCGYMARTVFIMDKLLNKIGLSGKAFIPLVMGFGCSVPAILGTRIIENKKSRQLAIFLIPFMSCSAKMPLYLLFASTFFASNQFALIFLIYILGIPFAVITAYILKKFIFKNTENFFVMELPEYKVPSFKNLRIHVWDRIKDFLERAGTVILGATLTIWFLQSFDLNLNVVSDSSKSILSAIGNFIAPLFSPCGFGNWQAAVSLLSGIIAKESIVSTMNVVYCQSNQQIFDAFSPLSAFSFMIFVLLYTPCVAAVATMYKELQSIKLTVISVLYQFILALTVSALVFQFGSLIQNLVM